MDSLSIYTLMIFRASPLLQAINRVWMEQVVHRPEEKALQHLGPPTMPGCAPYAPAAQLRSPRRRPKPWSLVVCLSTIICTQGVFFSKHPRWVGFWDVNFWTINQCFSWWFWNKKATKKTRSGLGEVPLQETLSPWLFCCPHFFLKTPPHHQGSPHHLRSLPIGISQLPCCDGWNGWRRGNHKSMQKNNSKMH